MYPTRAQVKQRFGYLLDDPTLQVFVDSPAQAPTISTFQQAFAEAYDALYQAFLNYECPRITNILQGIAIPPYTKSITPAQMGISDFGQYEYLSERWFGSQDRFIDLTPRDRLDQLAPSDRLREFVWRNDTFYFVGATALIELQIEYETSGEAPTADSTVICVDGCLSFLANYAAGKAGPWKGRDEIADRCWQYAVGPKYDQGTIGGELFRIIQPRVRQRQKVQMAHKPYTAGRRLQTRFQVPYVAAQQGTTGGGATNVPIQYSTAPSIANIVGAVNGANAIFTLLTSGVVLQLSVYRNGVFQTAGTDYIALNNQITFMGLSIPQSGDIISAEAFLDFNGVSTGNVMPGYGAGGYGVGGFGG